MIGVGMEPLSVILELLKPDGTKVADACVCDVCGGVWIPDWPTSWRLPQACPKRKCRTECWNGRKSNVGRPDRGQITHRPTAKGLLPMPRSDGKVGHHPLCPCILCLTGIIPPPPKVGRPRGVGGKCGKWKSRSVPRGRAAKRKPLT